MPTLYKQNIEIPSDAAHPNEDFLFYGKRAPSFLSKLLPIAYGPQKLAKI